MANKWTSKTQFPLDNYIVRCKGENFGPSNSSGNPMITLEFEIVSPEMVDIAGEQFVVAGQDTQKFYVVTMSLNEDGSINVEKSANNAKRVEQLYTMFGLPVPSDMDNPSLGFTGLCVWALVGAEATEKRKAPTAEQLKAGQKQGDVINNPVTGQPLISYWPKIQEIFGLAKM